MGYHIYIYCVWPIVCNSFHKLEHNFCTEGNTKEHDLEHDLVHGGEHQNSTILHGGENNFHGAHTKKHDLEHGFCTEENTKEHDPEHHFCTEGSTKTATIFARRGTPKSTI